MRRIVICCDGSWQGDDSRVESNVRKIARAADGVGAVGSQVVYYSAGVGTIGGAVERMITGAFGFGLDRTLLRAYRFLAHTYEPGDQIFIFGFSRGAYTARSLVGMIATVGLLTPKNASAYLVAQGAKLYRERPLVGTEHPDSGALRWFRRHCHPAGAVRIAFLGVFDTVGELGIPGLSGARYRFHNVQLTEIVDVARHALAINDRRRAFQPCLWTYTAAERDRDVRRDVKQVWFTGVHSDVGGGYSEDALSDAALRWMVRETRRCGLELTNADLEVPTDLTPRLHQNMTNIYRLYNVGGRLRSWLRRNSDNPRFRGDWRVLEVHDIAGESDLAVAIADLAIARWLGQDDAQRDAEAPNIGWWLDDLESHRIDVTTRVEDVSPEPIAPPA